MESNNGKILSKSPQPISERQFLERLQGNLRSPNPIQHELARKAIDNRLQKLQNTRRHGGGVRP